MSVAKDKIMVMFTNLSEQEQKEVEREIIEYNQKSTWGKQLLDENIKKRASLGPTASFCQYCGK